MFIYLRITVIYLCHCQYDGKDDQKNGIDYADDIAPEVIIEHANIFPQVGVQVSVQTSCKLSGCILSLIYLPQCHDFSNHHSAHDGTGT